MQENWNINLSEFLVCSRTRDPQQDKHRYEEPVHLN